MHGRRLSTGTVSRRFNFMQRAARVSFADADRSMQVYLRDLTRFPLMKADEERAELLRIGSLRCELWWRLLGHPPVCAAIVEQVLALERPEQKPEHVEHLARAMIDASRALRDRHTRAHLDAWESARHELSAHAFTFDPDTTIADAVLEDLERMQRGEAPELLACPVPRRDSRPFADYLAAARQPQVLLAAAKIRFAEKNLRLVIAAVVHLRSTHMAPDDLVAEGNVGLMRAISRFDCTCDFRFSTYAMWWIRHAVNRYVENHSRVVRSPVHHTEKLRKVLKLRPVLEQRLGRPVTRDDLATEAGLDLAELDRLMAREVQTTSLDVAAAPDGEDGDLHGVLADTSLPDLDALLDQDSPFMELLREELEDLSFLERDILHRRFGFDGAVGDVETGKKDTLRLIADDYGLSRERIRKIEAATLTKLRRALVPKLRRVWRQGCGPQVD
jgi:RNA polymerase primary sigma factor